jgi:hypothetical protein
MTTRAEVVDLPLLSWSAGAPRPFLVSSETRTLFGFYAPDDGITDDQVRVAEFVGCFSVRFGFPNDEVLNGHPLWGRGLEFYAAHEVLDSPWLTELRQIELHHEQAPAVPFAEAKHFLLTFHDSTLEAIADAVVVHCELTTMNAAITWMTDVAVAR